VARAAPGVHPPRGTYSLAMRVPAAQLRAVVGGLERQLRAEGGELSDLVSLTVFVTRISDREALEEVRRELFPVPPPASTMVEVSGLAEPGLVVEVQAVAAV